MTVSYLPDLTVEFCKAAGAFDFEASDAFTRADSAVTLGSADTLQPWTTVTGTAGISSNTAYFAALSGGVGLSYVRSLAGGDVQVTLSTVADGCGVVFRLQDASNYWKAVVNVGSTRWDVYQVVAGVATLKGSTGVANVSNGVTVKIRAEGTTITIYIDGVAKTLTPTISDATLQYQPNAGLYAASTSARFDNFSASVVWTDISSYVHGIPSIKRGRQHELAQMETGTCDLILSNTDRRFDPAYTSGAYYPFIVPLRRIRVTATWSAVTYRLFTGHVERWPLDYNRMATDGTVEITCVDRTAVIGTGLWSNYPGMVLGFTPRAYWRMGAA